MKHFFIKLIPACQMLTAASYRCLFIPGDKLTIPIVMILVVGPIQLLSGSAGVVFLLLPTGSELFVVVNLIVNLLFYLAIWSSIACLFWFGLKRLDSRWQDIVALVATACLCIPLTWVIKGVWNHPYLIATIPLALFLLFATLNAVSLIIRVNQS